jgi:hypothetical protein
MHIAQHIIQKLIVLKEYDENLDYITYFEKQYDIIECSLEMCIFSQMTQSACN